MRDVIIVGSAVIDIFIDSYIKRKGKYILIPADEKILVNDPKIYTGGGGTNVAVALSKLGLKTEFIGKIGNDSNGALILHDLENNKVHFNGKIERQKTGFSFILDSKDKHRTIFTYRGPNNLLKESEVSPEKIKARWIYLAPANGDTLKSQLALAKKAHKRRIMIAFNPSIHAGKKIEKEIFEIIKISEVLLINREELKILFKGKIEEAHRNGARMVCVTDGDKEIEGYDGLFRYKLMPHKIKVVEPTGAGDAFGAGFVYGLMRWGDMGKAMEAGLANSQGTIMRCGAKNGLLNQWEIEKKMNEIKVRRELAG